MTRCVRIGPKAHENGRHIPVAPRKNQCFAVRSLKACIPCPLPLEIAERCHMRLGV